MPNLCMNTLVIRGTKQQRENFKKKYCEFVKKEYSDHEVLYLDFNKIIPEPETIDECPEEFILHNEKEARDLCLGWDENNPRKWFNWYKFHCNKWGCKWGADPYDYKETKTGLWLNFDTPWCPPIGIIRKLIIDNYDLKIKCSFDEPGMNIHGIISWDDFSEEEIENLKEDK